MYWWINATISLGFVQLNFYWSVGRRENLDYWSLSFISVLLLNKLHIVLFLSCKYLRRLLYFHIILAYQIIYTVVFSHFQKRVKEEEKRFLMKTLSEIISGVLINKGDKRKIGDKCNEIKSFTVQ